MKAVCVDQFGPFAQARYAELPDPKPGQGEITVAVDAVETNYPDILMMEGRYQVKPALPFVPGKGIAGRIVDLGAGVDGFTLGQRVAVQLEHGGYATRVCAPTSWCYPIPDAVASDVAAASLLTYQTAWFALTDRAGLRPGETVLVLGAGGGVGVASMQLAKALGAGVIIGATRGSLKADFVRASGADAVVDLTMPDLRSSLRAEVQRLTGGAGIDIVIDPIGGTAFEPALRTLNWRGRYIVVGFAGGDIPVARTNYLLVRNISVMGLQSSDYRDRWPIASADAQVTIFRFIARGAISPAIDATYPLSQFAHALTHLAGGHARGKVLLTPAE